MFLSQFFNQISIQPPQAGWSFSSFYDIQLSARGFYSSSPILCSWDNRHKTAFSPILCSRDNRQTAFSPLLTERIFFYNVLQSSKHFDPLIAYPRSNQNQPSIKFPRQHIFDRMATQTWKMIRVQRWHLLRLEPQGRTMWTRGRSRLLKLFLSKKCLRWQRDNQLDSTSSDHDIQ